MNEREAQLLAREHLNRANEHEQAYRLGYALRDYRRSIAVFPTPEAHVAMGATLRLMDRYEEAIEACHQAIALDPDFGEAYHDIGAYLLELHQWDNTQVWFDLALNAPNYKKHCDAYFNLGRIHEYHGRFEEALINYRAALADNPDDMKSFRGVVYLLAKAN